METLMELIDKAKTETEQKVSENKLNTGQTLKELGFTKASENILSDLRLKEKINNVAKYKYLKITDSMIHTYLDTKVKNYNNLHIKEESEDGYRDHAIPVQYGYFPTHSSYGFPPTYTWTIATDSKLSRSDTVTRKIINISKSTCDFYSNKKDTIGQFVWKECPIEEYEGIPPKEVLDKLRVHKDRLLFDYFTIASIENIKDPLLFGRINNSTDRYFIAQWGEDILLDDII